MIEVNQKRTVFRGVNSLTFFDKIPVEILGTEDCLELPPKNIDPLTNFADLEIEFCFNKLSPPQSEPEQTD